MHVTLWFSNCGGYFSAAKIKIKKNPHVVEKIFSLIKNIHVLQTLINVKKSQKVILVNCDLVYSPTTSHNDTIYFTSDRVSQRLSIFWLQRTFRDIYFNTSASK